MPNSPTISRVRDRGGGGGTYGNDDYEIVAQRWPTPTGGTWPPAVGVIHTHAIFSSTLVPLLKFDTTRLVPYHYHMRPRLYNNLASEIITLHASGHTVREIAHIVGVSKSTVHRMIHRAETAQCV